MRLSRFLFLFAGVCVVGAFAQQQASRQAARVFGNATYVMWDGYAAQEATLVDGVHDEPYLHVRYDDRYLYGDFNGDGLQDAAVIVIENNGGQAHWHHLAFLIHDGEKLVHKASYFLDDSAIINSMREKHGKVVIDMFVHREEDCRAGPTKRVMSTYAYEGPDRWGEVEKSPYQRIYTAGTTAFQEIYDTPIPLHIRQVFDRTVVDPSCSESVFMGLFTKKFIIVEVQENGVGGIVATLVSEGGSNPFLLWMDDTSDGRYELRRMAELPGLLGEGFVRRLRNPAYRQYWL